MSKNGSRNFVAKNMDKFCKHRVFKDRKNDYQRKPKHRKKIRVWAF